VILAATRPAISSSSSGESRKAESRAVGGSATVRLTERFRQYTFDVAPVDDLLAETVDMVWRLGDRQQIDQHTRRPLGELVDELQRDAAEWKKRVEDGADFSVQRYGNQHAVVEVRAG
jgi:hypothetical protein